MKKIICLLILVLTLCLAFTACATTQDGDDNGKDDGGAGGEVQDDTVRVMVTPSEGVTVTSENPQNVKKGENAVFYITIEDGYIFDGVPSGCLYDPSTGKLTVYSVTERVTVEFNARAVLYGSTSLIYDLNDGTLNQYSTNMKATTYRYSEFEAGRLAVTFTSQYTDVVDAASTFYDDGTFHRDGYALVEYNTKPDGSGEAYSLGSKVAFSEGGTLLYCIWERETDASLFEYEGFNYPRPTSADRAPGWVEVGIKITGYSGTESTVTIPEKIDGKYVTCIGSGAFVNCTEMETLVLTRKIQKIEDGAFSGCTSIKTIYYPDGLYSISNAALDEASYTSLKNLYVNATTPPRFSKSGSGAFAIKLCRLLATEENNRIIVISGSSTYQGLSSEYMEALFEDRYSVINFGTTRTANGIVYLEAMQHYTHEGDVVVYAPENSTYMMGETELYFKTLRDIEGMLNLFRYIDISNYTNVFSAFSDYNQNYRYTQDVTAYEDIVSVINKGGVNKYGEALNSKCETYCVDTRYTDVYFLTLNEYYKSKYEGDPHDKNNQAANKDYTDPNNVTWEKITSNRLSSQMNRAIALAKSGGAKVYFGFCPADASRVVSEAKANITEWLANYENMIKTNFGFDGVVGNVSSYLLAHEYFYDNAFHVNYYGRTYRTYQLYVDLCAIVGIDDVNGIKDFGTDFEGCLFESGETPLYKPSYN
ncbi:MAG: leucine-rich repeat protein [Clostridia bacterium]|nr:leucine-rich repeat protein [Clostridia bacterium]